MKTKELWWCLGATIALSACSRSTAVSSPSVASAKASAQTISGRWASSDDARITVNTSRGERVFLTKGNWDFKPSWSKTGSMLVFFRLLEVGPDPMVFTQWKTKICVVKADGTGFRELTIGQYADVNPTWTRDGTNQIVFNRLGARGADSNDIYMIAPGGSIGTEVLVSNPDNRLEWAFSALKDGRIFIDRIDPWTPSVKSFLLTPRRGAVGTYQEIARPTSKLWQKLSVSPSETKIAYMLDNDGNLNTFNDQVLFYADFDVGKLTVSSPVQVTDYDPRCVHEYPRWSADDKVIIYDTNCSGTYQMYAYRLSDRKTIQISRDATTNSQFGTLENVPQ
jgi:Tol biopolymer transport system component